MEIFIPLVVPEVVVDVFQVVDVTFYNRKFDAAPCFNLFVYKNAHSLERGSTPDTCERILVCYDLGLL